MNRLSAVVLVVMVFSHGTRAQSANEVVTATKINAGLCVHVGVTDGALEVDLAGRDRMVVHGLALTDGAVKTARDRIQRAKLYGLASVERATALPRLPYADGLVNLLIIDRDALGASAPSNDEIMRAVAPFGAAYVRSDGAWTTTHKPLRPGTDEWTHYSYNAEGTCFSNDTELEPTNAVKWIGGPNAVKRMRMDWKMRILLSGGKWFHDSKAMSPNYDGPVRLLCRDAFNGTIVWDTLRDVVSDILPWQYVAADGKLFAMLSRTGKPVALDAATGAVSRVYENGFPNAYRRYTDNANQIQLAYAVGKLLQTSTNRLVALDAEGGGVLWQHADPDTSMRFYLPTIDVKGGRVFLLVHNSREFRGWSRWPDIQARKIICLKLADGTLMWSNTRVDWDTTGDFRAPNVTLHFDVGQMLYENGVLVVFGGHGLARQHAGFNWARMTIDAATGATIAPPRISKYIVGKPTPYSAVLKAGKLFGGSGALLRYDARTLAPDGGTMKDVDDALSIVAAPQENQRCGRTHGGGNYVIFGFNSFFDTRNSTFTYTSITSTRCAETGVPGYGMLYHAPTGCACIPGALVGDVALYHNPAPATPIADNQRIETGDGQASAASPQTDLGVHNDIQLDWESNFFDSSGEVSVDAGGGTSLVARIHQQRLDAVSGGQVKWSFVTGGRISKPPVVSDGRVYFGAHDGWVYCVNLSNGAQHWRFMAAPEDRRIGAYGQVESAWPVYGVALINGKVVASAGRNPETDGGIWVWGLEPSNGAVAWKKRIYITHFAEKLGTRSVAHYANKIANGVPSGSGDQVSLPGITFNTSTPGDIELQLTTAQAVIAAVPGPNLAPPSSFRLTSIEVFDDCFRLPRAGFATVGVFDMSGRLVERVFEGMARAGVTRFRTTGKRAPGSAAGCRIIRLAALGEVDEFALVDF